MKLINTQPPNSPLDVFHNLVSKLEIFFNNLIYLTFSLYFFCWYIQLLTVFPKIDKLTPQNAHEDDTCVSSLGDTAVECSAFSMFWPYVETPFMIVSSEADPVVHFCADNPALGENTPGSFAREWREGMVELTQQVIDREDGVVIDIVVFVVESWSDFGR